MGEDEELLPGIDINKITLYPEMNEKIAGLLKIRNNDIVSMYAAKLIDYLQERIISISMDYAENESIEEQNKIPVLKVFRKDESVILPRYEKAGDSGLDLRSAEEVEIAPLSRAVVSTGLVVELPPGHEGQVRPRSGLAAKHGITVLNTPGTVDNCYRGEVKAILFNTSREIFRVEKGMRIAQLVVAPVVTVEVSEVGEEELIKTERGVDGFGSTGHK